MGSVKYEATATFKDGRNNKEVISVESYSNDSDVLRDELWGELAKKYMKPVPRIKSKWSMDSTLKVSFANPPWDSWNDLESFLEGIQEVTNARYEDPMKGYYRAPRYHLRTKDGSTVKKKVENYYGGLVVSRSGDKVVVIISPFKNP